MRSLRIGLGVLTQPGRADPAGPDPAHLTVSNAQSAGHFGGRLVADEFQPSPFINLRSWRDMDEHPALGFFR